MEIGEYYFSKRQAFTLVLLIIGMIAGLNLLQSQQNIKSRAATADTFKFYENAPNRTLIACQGESCNIKSANLIIQSEGQNRPPAPVPAQVIVPPPPPPPITAKLAVITNTAAQITTLLSKGSDGFYNVKRNEPGIYYWCTFIVVDAYNAAGLNGLSRASNGLVLNMKSFFASTPGYQLLSSGTPVEQLRPGDVIFFEGKDQHASLVKSIDMSEAGNGVIRTFEANNVVLEDVVSVSNHRALSAQTTAGKLQITGFGQATGE